MRPAERPFFPSPLGLGDATTYCPCSGARFLTRDPLEAITREPYGYVGGNPINFVDPSGLWLGEGLVEKAVDVVVAVKNG